jgi:ATP-dependent DNA helicase RecG
MQVPSIAGSPGNLPNHLIVEKIRAGNSVIRNPVLASYAAKGVLPYRGLGTSIRRALTGWPTVDLIDDRDACTFTAIVGLPATRNAPRTVASAPIIQGNAPINAPLTDLQRSMLALIAADPSISYDALAATLGCDRTTVMRNVRVLKTMGLLRREGSRKTGRWVVVS